MSDIHYSGQKQSNGMAIDVTRFERLRMNINNFKNATKQYISDYPNSVKLLESLSLIVFKLTFAFNKLYCLGKYY